MIENWSVAPLIGDTWQPGELGNWSWPLSIAPSVWAERFRKLEPGKSNFPGPWRNATAPYLAGYMDLFDRPDVEEINVMKAGQLGISDATRNVIARWGHLAPEPTLIVLPDEKKAKKIFRKDIIPIFRKTPVLRELLTGRKHDETQLTIYLRNGFILSAGWSGSPSTLTGDPQCYVMNDEVDKFSEWSGRESDPVSLAYTRTSTFGGRRKIANISTPTTRLGMIFSLWDKSPAKLYFFVPCPSCETWQRLVFDRVRWRKPKYEDQHLAANDIVGDRDSTWYECEKCSCKWTDADRFRAIQRGRWAADSAGLSDASPMLPAVIGSPKVGIHLSVLYATWKPLREVAARFIQAQGEPTKMMNFRNEWLGEVFEQQVIKTSTSQFSEKCRETIEPGLVPIWASIVLATVDVQKDRFYWVVRAWGPHFRSRRLAHGQANTFDELRERCLDPQWESETPDTRPAMECKFLGIDTGFRTDEVYRFVLEDPIRRKPMKGDPRPLGLTPHAKRHTYRDPARRHDPKVAYLNFFDANTFKDWLAGQIAAQVDGEDVWELNAHDDADYNRQMAAEHKVVVREGRKRAAERWVKRSDGAQNHYFDCEVMQAALARIARVDLLSIAGTPRASWKQRRVDRRVG